MKRPMYPQGPTVTPQQFGAKADGKTDDIHALHKAREYASLHGLPLELEGDYYTSTTWKLDNVTIISRNARISYHGEEFNRPAIEMFDYVYIFGDFNVWAIPYAPPMTHGNRCGIAFGDYDSGRGAHHCYFENVITWGSGMPGGNGMLLTGDTSDILFDKVTVPEGHTFVNVPIMLHWGGYGEHHPADLANPSHTPYVHDEGYTRTKHPHDVTFGLIESHSAHSAIYISACYDITVGEIRQYGGRRALTVAAGDCGFKYATPEERAHGSRNIRFGKVYGENLSELGIYFNGIDSYEKDTLVEIDAHVKEAELVGKGEGSGNGICFYGVKNVHIEKLSLKGFAKSTFQLGLQNRYVQIDEATVEDCHANVITTYNSLEKKPLSGENFVADITENINISKLTVKNSGAENAPFASLRYIDGLNIGDLQVEDCVCDSMFQLYAGAKNVNVGKLTLANTTAKTAFVKAAEPITAENNIKITVSGADAMTPTAGEACDVTVINK